MSLIWKTLDGRPLCLNSRQDFARALRNHVSKVKRNKTPPPDPPDSTESLSSPWVVDSADRLAIAQPYDGPGKWLICREVAAFHEKSSIQVAFKAEYDDGRWNGRTAKMQNPWLAVDPPGLLEVPLTWTGNKAERRTANVPVHLLDAVRPVMGGEALVIDGEHVGKVVTVIKRKRGGQGGSKMQRKCLSGVSGLTAS